jgi:hypothetical protein
MQQGQLLMTQADRDRLVTLRKLKKKQITQSQATDDLKVRHVKRLLRAFKQIGDKVVIHRLRVNRSNRRIEEKVEEEAVTVLPPGAMERGTPAIPSHEW